MKINCTKKLIKLLAINSVLLLQLNSAFTMQNANPINIQDVKQNNTHLMEYEYGNIWNDKKIQDATNNLELKLETWGYDNTLSELNNAVLFVISNGEDIPFWDTEISKKASKQYLNYIIKKNIVSKINSLEENINNLLVNIRNDKSSEDEIWKIILEDYSDKYINNDKELNNNLNNILTSPLSSGEIMFISQQYKDKISEKIGKAFSAINAEDTYTYFENKFYDNKKDNEHIIYCHLLDIFTNIYGKAFINLVEKNGFNTSIQFINNARARKYIQKILLQKIFEDEIIKNNISVYTLLSNDLNYKYKDTTLNNEWKEYINCRLANVFNNDSIRDKANSILNQYKETNLNKYNVLKDNILQSILQNMSLLDIINQYGNEYNSNIIIAVYIKLFNTILDIKNDIISYKSLDTISQNNNVSAVNQKQIYDYLINIKKEVLISTLDNIPLQNILNKYSYFTQTFVHTLSDDFVKTMIEITKDILEHKTLNQIVKDKTEEKSFVIKQIYDSLILLQYKLRQNLEKCKSEEVNTVIEQYENKYDNYIVKLFANDILNQISQNNNQGNK